MENWKINWQMESTNLMKPESGIIENNRHKNGVIQLIRKGEIHHRPSP
jgi:hypothetical protein